MLLIKVNITTLFIRVDSTISTKLTARSALFGLKADQLISSLQLRNYIEN